MDRNDLLERKQRKEKLDRVPIVLTYSKILPDVRDILRKHQNTLHQSDRLQKVFLQPPLLAFRRDKNLCDTLVHKKTNALMRQDDEKCKCELCKIIRRDAIQDTRSK